MELTNNTAEDKAIIGSLINSRWIDEHTGALMIEFTLFNSNTNLFSIIVLMAEFTRAGAIMPFYSISTMDLAKYEKFLDASAVVTEVIYIVMVIIFLCIETRKFAALRLPYFYNLWNYVHLGAMILSLTFAVLVVKRANTISALLERNFEEKKSSFVNLYEAAFWDLTAAVILGILVFAVMINLWHMFLLNKFMFVCWCTLTLSLRPMLHFCFMSLILITPFVIIFSLLFVSLNEDFSTYMKTILCLIHRSGTFYATESSQAGLGLLFLCFFIFVFLVILFCTFRVIFIKSHQTALKDWENRKADYDFIDHIRNYFTKKKEEKIIAFHKKHSVFRRTGYPEHDRYSIS